MDLILTGFVKRVDWKNELVVFTISKTPQELKLDIFKLYKFRKFKKRKEEILELFQKYKGKFSAKGYCYNGSILIADSLICDPVLEDAILKLSL